MYASPTAFGWPGPRLRFACLLLAALITAGCSPVVYHPVVRVAAPVRPPEQLVPTHARHSAGVVASGGPAAPYNYGPSVLAESGKYRMWWCSQLPETGPAGDDVLHAESPDRYGPYRAGDAAAAAVFSGRPGGFDAMHTCDPSVIEVRGRYYLYYTGSAGEHVHGNAIGVASSRDGLHWRREAGGRPIVGSSGEVHRPNTYGAGQPAALFLDGWFYLMFTDTTGAAAADNGAGQFVLRARDPEFTDRVQRLTDAGFVPAGVTNGPRSRSVVEAFSADWMWVAELDAFAIAHQTVEGTTITFWDRGFTRHPYRPVVIPGRWREGPGLIRDAAGHAPRGTGRGVPVDVVRATEPTPAPTGLRGFGLDVRERQRCGPVERARPPA